MLISAIYIRLPHTVLCDCFGLKLKLGSLEKKKKEKQTDSIKYGFFWSLNKNQRYFTQYFTVLGKLIVSLWKNCGNPGRNL